MFANKILQVVGIIAIANPLPILPVVRSGFWRFGFYGCGRGRCYRRSLDHSGHRDLGTIRPNSAAWREAEVESRVGVILLGKLDLVVACGALGPEGTARIGLAYHAAIHPHL